MQLFIVAAGFKVTVPHPLPKTGKTTEGTFLTSTVFIDVKLPQGFVAVNTMEYMPELLKIKDGLAEDAFVFPVKTKEEDVPQ